MRLGHYLSAEDRERADRYRAAGLTILDRLLESTYLATDADHQGLLLHALYHRPQGWDHQTDPAGVPHGESCLWGDYHLMEAALLVDRLSSGETYPTFFGP